MSKPLIRKKRTGPTRSAAHVPHAVDDLIRVEPTLDAKLQGADPKKMRKLSRIARLECEATGAEHW